MKNTELVQKDVRYYLPLTDKVLILHWVSTKVKVSIKKQVSDQGLMFGYACNETPELMPLPIMLSHQIIKKVEEARHSKSIPYLRPDAKSQVTEYDENDKPIRVDTIVLSTQHDEDVTQETIKKDIEALIREVVDEKYLIDTKFHINPTSQFIIVELHGDTGLTGRKIIVDTYGGMARHGGGAFSGKDPTKVDESVSYGTSCC